MAEMLPSARNGFLDISPIRRHDANKENDIPVLSLIQFSKPPFVAFETVKVGTTKSTVLRIENPTEDVEADVTVEKIPSSKGFSVDHSTFTIEPEGSFYLTVSWTPSEEGGIRELIAFNANGILKHQAVLLGRAEAPKKKKKSLWDTIKNKKTSNVATPRLRKTKPLMKTTTNKTFQVSRKSQHRRDGSGSPLAALSNGRVVRRRSVTKSNHMEGAEDRKCLQSPSEPQRLSQMDSPVVTFGSPTKNDEPTTLALDLTPDKCENRNLAKLLNRTVSPVGTPERVRKLMPHIQSDCPLPAAPKPDSDRASTCVMSINDALALINSDLSLRGTSPHGMSSSGNFSDSLESKSERCEVEPLKPLPDSPELLESHHQRLTFFVSKKPVVLGDRDGVEKVKKCTFTSATVVKSKAPVEESHSSGRKIRKSRRRLLEKTLELSDGSGQCGESGEGSPLLPVIDADAGSASGDDTRILSEFIPSRPCTSSPHATFAPLPQTSIRFSIASPPHEGVAPLLSTHIVPNDAGEPAASIQAELFPVHVAGMSKKRKSDEVKKWEGKNEEVGKPEQVKRSKVMPTPAGHSRSIQERRAKMQKQRGTGSGHSTSAATLKTSLSAQRKQMSSRSVQSMKKTKVVAVAQSKLTFIKPAQTAIPRHPMPFAAKNMFYDERWIEKQERGFTWWINYVLTPDDFRVNTEVNKVNAVSLAIGADPKFSVPRAPTKEEMSFSTYTARRKLNRLRRSACQLFTSEAMVKAIQRLELEVEARRLLVRKDRHLWKDIGERKKVLNWLLSYNPLWLRIGLETVFGELISLESNSDTLGLAMFILQRLLWNPDIAAEYRHARVPHLYKDGHEEALSRFTLKKLLLLVCFLDKAKGSRLIEHNPCLFCVDAEFKSTKDLLLAFSRDFLSGEGILPRHLGYLGLPVSHVQTPLDEFDFAVKNLAVDLKCGIRLTRVMELLVQDWGLSAKLRLPAVSRLQKVHNVDIALQKLQSKGVDLKDEHGSVIDSRDIVDGHREKTLSLLWKIIFAFQVEVILDEHQLREEIDFLKKTHRTKRRLACLRADRGPQPSPRRSTLVSYKHTSTKITLLMDWVRAVCDFYNLEVENFTVAFSDGRAICFLIHHYHPSLLPAASISHSTTQTVECSPTGRLELDCSVSDSDGSFDSPASGSNGPNSPSVEFKELLENEKNNFKLVNSAVGFLGGVPAMINPTDMSNTIPSEKVVMSYLSFLCTRLLDLRNETRAARIIQSAWRKYRLKKDLQLYQERNRAALVIQPVVRRFLQKRKIARRTGAALLIQSAWRGYVARRNLRLQREARLQAVRQQAATILQAQWRMFSAFRDYHRLRHYTVIVQAQWRMRRAVDAYGKTLFAVMLIQKHVRAWAISKRERASYLLFRTSVVKIQRAFRRWKDAKAQRENRAATVIQAAFKKWYEHRMAKRSKAAVKIQAWYKGLMCRHKYRRIYRSVVLLQAFCRGHAQRHRYQMLKEQQRCAVILQSAFRGMVVRKQTRQMKIAAVLIQRRFRASVRRDEQRREFLKIRHSALILQAVYRGKAVRAALEKQRQAALIIQTTFKKYAARKQYLDLRRSAIVMQRRFRASIQARNSKREFDSLKASALVFQAHWRGRADRKKLEMWHRSAAQIQAAYRCHKMQSEFVSMKSATLVLQRRYRALVAGRELRQKYLEKRAACVSIQAWLRGLKVRSELAGERRAACVIQSWIRMFLCRKRYFLLQCAAIIIQSRYRALLMCRAAQQEYKTIKQATVKIQATFRGFRVRWELKRENAAATAIQAQFRMHRIRMAYLATKVATILIQERYRATKLRDRQLQQYKTMKSAAVVIQAAFRGHAVRRKKAEMGHAATVIQRKYRAILSRRQFLKLKAGTLVLQQSYRAQRRARQVRLGYLLKRNAAIRLQAAYRGHEVRKKLCIQRMAAVKIQSYFKMYKQRRIYRRLRWASCVVKERYKAKKLVQLEMNKLKAARCAAVCLQAAYRGFRARQELKREHGAATTIQAQFRMHRSQMAYLATKVAAILIQKRYKATKLRDQQLQQFKAIKSAAVVIQAAFRGQMVRKRTAEMHRRATVIQRTYRTFKARKRFLAIRAAAVTFQQRYRSQKMARQTRLNYLTRRDATICLQAACRGYLVRKNLHAQQLAAVTIQSYFRMQRQKQIYGSICSACRLVQKRYRAKRLMQVEMEKLRAAKRAVVCLQAAFRGFRVRQSLRRKQAAASTIQAQFRMHRTRMAYLATKVAAILIQERFRATKLRNQQLQHYRAMKSATILIQAAFRGHMVRRRKALWDKAAIVIQTKYRSTQARKQFLSLKAAVLTLQLRYRSKRLTRQVRLDYLKRRNATICLQAAHRGYMVRKQLHVQQMAAVTIQSYYRMHKQRYKYEKIRRACCIVQARYRAKKLVQLEMEKLKAARGAIVRLQAACRGSRVRQELKREQAAATIIQAQFRMHRTRMAYLATKVAALLIQKRYRATKLGNQERQHYSAMKSAAILIQAAFRGHGVRKRNFEMHQAAGVIQRKYRSVKARKQFLTLKAAAVTFQQRYRAQRVARKVRLDYLSKRKATICLQAVYRGQVVRKKHRVQQIAAVTIQSCYRMHKQRRTYARIRWACIVMQKRYRAQKLVQLEMDQLKCMRDAVVHLQAAYRGMKARQGIRMKHQAAAVIQKAYRAHCERRTFLAIRSSILTLQRRYRATVAAKRQSRQYLLLKEAAVVLQAAYRGRQVRKELFGRHRAATVVQSAFRRHRERVKFQAMRLSAMIIQRHYRALLLQRRDRRSYLQLKQSAILIQATFRGQHMRAQVAQMCRAAVVIQANYKRHKQQTFYRRLRWAVVSIQQKFRAKKMKEQQRLHYQSQRRAAVVIQAAYRGMKSRRVISLKNQAAAAIQRAYKGYCERRMYLKLRLSATTIQRRYKATVKSKEERARYIQMRLAAITVQRCWRARMAMRQVMEAAYADRRLCFAANAFYHLCALKIQRALRAHWALKSAKKQIHSVVTIQRWLRAKRLRRQYMEYRAKVVSAQRAVRRWLARRHAAASVLQQAVRQFLLVKRQRRAEQGLVKVQALWRGHCSRKFNDNPKLVKLRHRLRVVSAGVREEDKLGNKTASALDYLLRYKHFSFILEALKKLETATRLSPECCERLVESGATSVIFTLIRCCNRSVPCMDVITFSVQILLNLSKYHKTIEAVYSVENSVETLLDLLQRYREKAGDKVAEKGGSIFTKACFLLALLLQDRGRAEDVLKQPKALDKIRSIYHLTARKHKMDAERTIVKQKMNASVNGSFFVPATPRKARPAPKFAPDWVLKKNKLKDIVDPLRAIQMVADTLAIVL